MAEHINKKKWLVLGAVATALLIIPRRSSRKTETETELYNINRKKNTEKSNAESMAVK